MSFAAFDDSPAWAPEPNGDDIVTSAIKKEAVLKEIAASQDDLRLLLSRVQTLQKEVEKLSTGNETLQMYIDNLTKQMAKRR
ncbi:hypothetical protein BD626DRAFT_493308 [Schizophyllum amplum]|uniref:BZIP transcription factor n=1 Tax=Schizophyllum amplum TaxID=97359 RepID=A0A550CGL8_9AGAR|nr:hypothetical protein BD626DRAFT_493308 [Auriculariopsis ampla]